MERPKAPCEYYRIVKRKEQRWVIAVRENCYDYVRRHCDCGGDKLRCDFKKTKK